MRVIDFFITFASDTTFAHAISMHRVSSFRDFYAEKDSGWGLVSRHNIKAFT